MELPPLLRRAVDNALNGTALSDLTATAAALSDRYREERHDIKPRVISDREALAYLAVRLPATYAAIRSSFNAVAEARPDFMPGNALDVGAGPGTALWAAAECWPAVSEALLVEASPIFRTYGERLAAEAELPHVTWRVADIAVDAIDSKPRDLVTMAYVLNELAPKARHSILQQLWQLTTDTLVIVEPGTPAGWQRIIAARNQLIEAGAHARACPLQPPDWCHFAQRIARSRVHQQTKRADVPWEDEKFSYVAVSRKPAARVRARVIARPRKADGHITLKLCRPDGLMDNQSFSRREARSSSVPGAPTGARRYECSLAVEPPL
jgi:ribosomal protein RSM22 (predicted rRNA methylase)